MVFRHQTEWRGHEQISDEKHEIEPIAQGVRLTQTIDLSRAVPAWALALIWLINRIGSKQGTSNLECLRRLVQQKEA